MEFAKGIKKILKDEQMVGLRLEREIDNTVNLIVDDIKNNISGVVSIEIDTPQQNYSLMIDRGRTRITLETNTVPDIFTYGIGINFSIDCKYRIHVTNVCIYGNINSRDIINGVIDWLGINRPVLMNEQSYGLVHIITKIMMVLFLTKDQGDKIINRSNLNLSEFVFNGILLEKEVNDSLISIYSAWMTELNPHTTQWWETCIQEMKSYIGDDDYVVVFDNILGGKIQQGISINIPPSDYHTFGIGPRQLTIIKRRPRLHNAFVIKSGLSLTSLSDVKLTSDNESTSPIYDGYITDNAIILGIDHNGSNCDLDIIKKSEFVMGFKFTINNTIINIVTGSIKFFFYGGGSIRCDLTQLVDIKLALYAITRTHLSIKYSGQNNALTDIDINVCMKLLLFTVNAGHCLYISNIKNGLGLKFNINYTIE
jgi:hypothetical protein